MKKICLITLGCKTNQYESEALGELLEQKGYDISYSLEKADVYVLNSCAVTNEAERKSRQTISKFVRLNPKCKIYVCGCASQNNCEQFSALPNVKGVIGNANILSLLDKITANKKVRVEKLPDFYEDLQISKPTRARAYVKIQDGCNRFCSYCLIPYLRGKSRSRSIISILQEAEKLKQGGAKEIVLTGVDISDYRIDDKLALVELLTELNKFKVRIRLGSIEPNLLSEEFIKKIAKLKYFCPHFHISMQSGSTATLKRMNRHYTAQFFIERTKLLRQYFPNCAITTDLIIGFPGESDDEFEETIKTVKKIKFSQMHVFPYSRRAGTTADKLLTLKSNKEFFAIDGNVKKERMAKMLELAKKFEKAYINKQKNFVLKAVIEEIYDNFLIGTTENYVKVYIANANKNKVGKIVKVQVLKVFQDGALAKLV